MKAPALKRLFNGLGAGYDRVTGFEARMFKRMTIVATVMAFGFMVSGCSKCGFWLDEWANRPAKSCKGDFPN